MQSATFLRRENLFAFKIGRGGLRGVNFVFGASQNVLIYEEEVGELAGLDTAAFILKEHLLRRR